MENQQNKNVYTSPQLKHLSLLKQQTEELKQKLAQISDKYNKIK